MDTEKCKNIRYIILCNYITIINIKHVLSRTNYLYSYEPFTCIKSILDYGYDYKKTWHK